MKVLSQEKRMSKSRIAACFAVILLVAVLAIVCASCSIFSSEIVIEHLDIDVTLRSDGYTVFRETSEAKFSSVDGTWWCYYRIIEDESLLKRLRSDSTAFSPIEDSFSVNGQTVDFVGAIDIGDDDKAKYTSLYRDKPVGYWCPRQNGIEIGVILPEFDSGIRTISYAYAVKGIVTGIDDAAVFYYQYLSENNAMDVDEMSVKVNFPEAEADARHWLHVSADAVGVWKESDDKKSITLTLEDVSAGEYVETRLLLDKSHFTVAETKSGTTIEDIVAEETKWESDYRRQQRIILAVTILDYVLAVLAVAGGIAYLIFLKKRNRPTALPDAPIYYRDIPEGYTGGEVSPLYFYYSNENYIDESISASMLELVRLNYISIEPDEARKGAIVTVLKQDEEDEIRTHQKLVLEMLSLVKPMGTPFTMKEFEKYGKNHPGKMMQMVEKFRSAILNKSQRDGAYRKDNPVKEKAQKFSTSMVGVGAAVIILSGFLRFVASVGMFFFGMGLIIGGLIPYLFLRNAKAPLTVNGQREYDKLQALSKFMQEFSAMDEHDIPELVLWEEYMIFATAMGIADKVAKQLEIAYPEFKTMSTSGFRADGFLILYFFSPSFRVLTGLNFVGNVANVVRSIQVADRALKAAAMARKVGGGIGGFGGGRGGGSSFHGGGGGFSGGGFGGRH